MSLIIKGMEMPEFPAFREKDNKVAFPAVVVLEKGNVPRLIVNHKIGYADTNIKSYELLELPTPHGRLIDAEELIKKLERHRDMCGDIETQYGIDTTIRILRNIPTLIEAEVSE